MLIFSSREPEGRVAASATGQQFAADADPPPQGSRKHAPQAQTQQEYCNMVQVDCDVDDTKSMNGLLQLFQQERPLLLYLHGHNSTPAVFFERCDRLQSLHGLEIVSFSWSAKKHPPDDGLDPGFKAGADPALRRELARLLGSRKGVSSGSDPTPLEPVACDLDNVTCAWWLLMALPGVRH